MPLLLLGCTTAVAHHAVTADARPGVAWVVETVGTPGSGADRSTLYTCFAPEDGGGRGPATCYPARFPAAEKSAAAPAALQIDASRVSARCAEVTRRNVNYTACVSRATTHEEAQRCFDAFSEGCVGAR